MESTNVGAVTVVAETDKAIRVELGDGSLVWVPKSVIDDDSEAWSLKNGEGDLIVYKWWADRNLG